MDEDSDDSRGAVNFNESDTELSDPEDMEFADDHFAFIPEEESKRQPILSDAYQQPPSENLADLHEDPLQDCKKSHNVFSKNIAEQHRSNLPEYWRDGLRCPEPQYQGGPSYNQPATSGWHHQPSKNCQAAAKAPSSQDDSGSESDGPPAGVRYFVPIGNKVGNNSRASDMYVPPPLPSTSAPSNYDVTNSKERGMFQFEENCNNNKVTWFHPDLEAPSTSALSNHDAKSYSTHVDKIQGEEDGNGNKRIGFTPDMNMNSTGTFSPWEIRRKTDFMQTDQTRLKKICDVNSNSTCCTPRVEITPTSAKSSPEEPRPTQLEENYSSNEGEKSTSSGSIDSNHQDHTSTEDAHNSALMIKKKPRCPQLAKRRTKKLVTCFGNLNTAVQRNRPQVKPRRVQILRNSANFIVKMKRSLAEHKEMIAILRQQNQAYEAEIRKLQALKGVPEAERIDLRRYECALGTSKTEIEQAPLEEIPTRETPNSSDMSSNEAYQPTPETSELSSDGADSNR